MKGLDNILYERLSPDIFCLVHNQLVKLQQENQQLRKINEEYERLNKENGRGFTITNVQEYDIHELLSYKNNWNELKKWIANEIIHCKHTTHWDVRDKIKELERGVSDVED